MFKTAFFIDLKFLFDVKINETLGQPVIHLLDHEIPGKMKLLFEDGTLISSLLGYGWIPFSAQLGFELHHEESAFSVAIMYNWKYLEFPSPGPCAGMTRCPYE
jgi:hypothetical protein